MKYTIGLDLGTHQTKCCVEERDKNYQRFYFAQFANTIGQNKYCLPSVVKLKTDGTLEYGFFSSKPGEKVFRYFKQATFNPKGTRWDETIDPRYISVWYLTYLILCLKKIVGAKYFNINMGIPTDSADFPAKKMKAVGLLEEAYRLAENVYDEDINQFLSASFTTLKAITNIHVGTEQTCKNLGIKVFPEAWACLRPLLSSNKITTLNMMIDIGGGTTDISLFSVVKEKRFGVLTSVLKIYYFNSINLGLNYLYSDPIHMENGIKTEEHHLDRSKVVTYNSEVDSSLSNFMYRLEKEFRNAARGMFNDSELDQCIRNKQSIYVGGGSVFKSIRKARKHFSDVRLINTKDWKMENIQSFEGMLELCPILSTSYGLAISQDEGTIDTSYNLRSLFDGIRKAADIRIEAAREKANRKLPYKSSFGKEQGGMDYGLDYDAWK